MKKLITILFLLSLTSFAEDKKVDISGTGFKAPKPEAAKIPCYDFKEFSRRVMHDFSAMHVQVNLGGKISKLSRPVSQMFSEADKKEMFNIHKSACNVPIAK